MLQAGAMADAPAFSPSPTGGFLQRNRALLAGYASLLSGSLGRLVFSLVFFLVLANTLPIAAFGTMAAASAMGVVLSRVCGFGFSSPLYRVATVKARLAGTYLAGYALFAVLSAPLVALLGWLAFALFFEGAISAKSFVLILLAEIALWRTAEILIIMNNGLGRFSLGAMLTIMGTAARMVAALVFAWTTSEHTLDGWAVHYFWANAAALAIAAVAGWPKSRIRLRPALYWRRMYDALAVAGGEVLFYAQMELDKVLMLALAGAETTGIYAIIMRLVDLTAIPIRSFNTLLVQSLMKQPDALASWKRRAALESGIAFVSTAAIVGLGLLLWWKPTLLGASVAVAAPMVLFAAALPGLRNAAEYHAELLYARGQTLWRLMLLALLAGVKAAGMAMVLSPDMAASELMLTMTGVFAAVYCVSAIATHSLVGRAPGRF
jgi:O-antigen/teichoic acid export membrane protein